MKSYAAFCVTRQIPFALLFIKKRVLVEIVMKVSHNETVLLLKKLIMRKIVKEITEAYFSICIT